MHLRFAAFAAGALLSAAHAAPAAAQALALDDAFQRVASVHPELRLLDARATALAVEVERAAHRPPLQAGVDVENALGTGSASGAKAMETTLTLASVLERGGKAAARIDLARAGHDAAGLLREARRLDLLAETARRFVAGAAAVQVRAISADDVQQRLEAVDAARRRFEAGAAPETAVLAAQAALARARLAGARAEAQWTAARRMLAALWGERDPAFELAPVDVLLLPELPDAARFANALDRLPDLARFADSRRIAEARVRLAEADRVPDLSWHVGVRRLEADNDVGLVAGVSLPLGTRQRAATAARSARLELETLAVEREASESALYLTLLDAHARYAVARLEVRGLSTDVLPTLVQAEQAASRAWRAGAASYLEWAAAQADVTATRRQQLDAALEAQLALIEIQRLSGEAFVPASAGETP